MSLDQQLRDVLTEQAERYEAAPPDFAAMITGGQVLRRRRRLVVTVSAFVVLAILAAGLAAGRDLWDTRADNGPAQTPTPEHVAAGFLDAYAAADGQRMATYMADDAHLVNISGAADRRWREAAGYRILNVTCQQQATTPAGIRVMCTFDYHMLGSDQLDRGPFPGDKLIATVKNDRIVAAKGIETYATNGFNSQMWTPFSYFVPLEFPKDARVMYSDYPVNDSPARTDQSIALWAKHTQDYVNEYR